MLHIGPLRISRRSIAVVVAAAGVLSLAIGAHAALSIRALDAAKAKAVAIDQDVGVTKHLSRLALVIGNGHYPDAGTPLTQPINDARALSAALHRDGFDVDMVEDATHDDMTRAVARLKSKIAPGSVVLLFFGGYGVQAGLESYMLPVIQLSGRNRTSVARGLASNPSSTR